ncbi:MAG: hypothetical protein AB7E16_05170 [Candidatus Izemoplasmatales bacterium]
MRVIKKITDDDLPKKGEENLIIDTIPKQKVVASTKKLPKEEYKKGISSYYSQSEIEALNFIKDEEDRSVAYLIRNAVMQVYGDRIKKYIDEME